MHRKHAILGNFAFALALLLIFTCTLPALAAETEQETEPLLSYDMTGQSLPDIVTPTADTRVRTFTDGTGTYIGLSRTQPKKSNQTTMASFAAAEGLLPAEGFTLQMQVGAAPLMRSSSANENQLAAPYYEKDQSYNYTAGDFLLSFGEDLPPFFTNDSHSAYVFSNADGSASYTFQYSGDEYYRLTGSKFMDVALMFSTEADTVYLSAYIDGTCVLDRMVYGTVDTLGTSLLFSFLTNKDVQNGSNRDTGVVLGAIALYRGLSPALASRTQVYLAPTANPVYAPGAYRILNSEQEYTGFSVVEDAPAALPATFLYDTLYFGGWTDSEGESVTTLLNPAPGTVYTADLRGYWYFNDFSSSLTGNAVSDTNQFQVTQGTYLKVDLTGDGQGRIIVPANHKNSYTTVFATAGDTLDAGRLLPADAALLCGFTLSTESTATFTTGSVSLQYRTVAGDDNELTLMNLSGGVLSAADGTVLGEITSDSLKISYIAEFSGDGLVCTIYAGTEQKAVITDAAATPATVLGIWDPFRLTVTNKNNSGSTLLIDRVSVSEYTSPMDLYAQQMPLEQLFGASVRMKSPSGLRFTTVLDAEVYELLLQQASASGASLSFGTVLVPTDYLSGLNSFTMDELERAGLAYLHFALTADDMLPFEEQEGYLCYHTSIVNLFAANYARDFSARSYMKVTYANGYESVLWADYDEAANSRNIYDVAAASYNERSAEQSAGFPTLTPEGDYSCYTEEQLESLREICDRVIRLVTSADADGYLTQQNGCYTPSYTLTQADISTEQTILTVTGAAEGAPVLLDGVRLYDGSAGDNYEDCTLEYQDGTLTITLSHPTV